MHARHASRNHGLAGAAHRRARRPASLLSAHGANPVAGARQYWGRNLARAREALP